jgi:Spy/CpxP family protein refolding chaperone
MTTLTKPRILTYAAVVFIAGLLAGVAAGYALCHWNHMGPPDPDKMLTRMEGKLRKELSLSEDQVSQIKPSLQQLSSELRNAHDTSFSLFSDLVHRFNDRIGPVLTPEQRTQLEKLTREREARFRLPAPGTRPKE